MVIENADEPQIKVKQGEITLKITYEAGQYDMAPDAWDWPELLQLKPFVEFVELVDYTQLPDPPEEIIYPEQQ